MYLVPAIYLLSHIYIWDVVNPFPVYRPGVVHKAIQVIFQDNHPMEANEANTTCLIRQSDILPSDSSGKNTRIWCCFFANCGALSKNQTIIDAKPLVGVIHAGAVTIKFASIFGIISLFSDKQRRMLKV